MLFSMALVSLGGNEVARVPAQLSDRTRLLLLKVLHLLHPWLLEHAGDFLAL
jgi:hypothetical protein